MLKKVTKNDSTFYPFTVAACGQGAVFIYGIKTAAKTSIFLYQSANGSDFSDKHELHVVSETGKKESLINCGAISFFARAGEYYLTYWRTVRGKRQSIIARSDDMVSFKALGESSEFPDVPVAIISNNKHNHKHNFLAYYGNKSVYVAASSNLIQWHNSGLLLSPRKDYFDDGTLHVIGTLMVEKGILVLYEARNKKHADYDVKIGAALFSLDKPYIPLWRSDEPIWEETKEKKNYPAQFLGSIIIGNSLHIYWSSFGNEMFSKTIDLASSGLVHVKEARQLKRHHANPILEPKAINKWEQDATFNPAALHLDGKIHLLYRAIGENGVSVFGYASSTDGFTIDERSEQPVFALTKTCEVIEKKVSFSSPYVSGGSWVGCEDPRITHVGKRIYMTYVMFDGSNPPGVALTSISVSDFLSKVWKWKKPKLISKTGEIQKNWMVFPEKINGKYAILHSITPNILIEYVDNLDSDKIIIESMKKPGTDEHRWDNIVRGAGAPPLMTKYGWLVLYHAMDKRDPDKYKVGAMILDYNDPTKILHRCKYPILEPSVGYENNGAKSGVVYVCGAVIKDNTLFVYYGGADSVVCVATENLDEFLEAMTKHVQCVVSQPSFINKISKSV